MNIGERLRNYRVDRGLTLEEAGARIGVSKQTLYKYEKGIVSNIPLPYIVELAKIYRVPAEVLVGWSEGGSYIERTKKAMCKLNDEGQAKVAGYAEDLLQIGSYALD